MANGINQGLGTFDPSRTNRALLERANPYRPFGDRLSENLERAGNIPKPTYFGPGDTLGGELLRGLGNLGLFGVDAIVRGSGYAAAPLAAGVDALASPTYEAYLRDEIFPAMDTLAGERERQLRQLTLPQRAGPVGASGIIAGGPTYAQTATPADQDAALRSQLAAAQAAAEKDGSVYIDENTGQIIGDSTMMRNQMEEDDPLMVGGNTFFPSGRPGADAMDAVDYDTVSQFVNQERGAASGDGSGKGATQESADQAGDPLLMTGTAEQDFGTGDSDDPDESPAEKAFKSGMDAYLAALGQDANVGSIEDYKKQFSDATGIDASGKVDNSTALMAFGLALMQNKAGKGFNVGEMLSAVGSAGEKALPAVAAAKKEAKAGQVAAGKFALQQRANDITTAIARRNKIADRIAQLSDKAYDRDTQLMVERLKGTIKIEDRRLQELAANQRASTESLANAGKLGEPKKILVGGFDKNKFEVQAQQVGDTNVFQIINPKGAMRTVDSMIRGSSSGLETARRMKEIAASGEITGYKNLFNTLQLVGEGIFSVPYSGEVDNKQAEYKAAVGKMLTQFRRLLTGGEAGNAISDRDVAIIEKNLGYLEQSLLGNVAVSSQEIIAKVENLEEMFEARLRDHSDFKRSLIEMGQPAGQYMEYNLGEDDDFTDDFLPNYTLTKGPTGNPRYVLRG